MGEDRAIGMRADRGYVVRVAADVDGVFLQTAVADGQLRRGAGETRMDELQQCGEVAEAPFMAVIDRRHMFSSSGRMRASEAVPQLAPLRRVEVDTRVLLAVAVVVGEDEAGRQRRRRRIRMSFRL